MAFLVVFPHPYAHILSEVCLEHKAIHRAMRMRIGSKGFNEPRENRLKQIEAIRKSISYPTSSKTKFDVRFAFVSAVNTSHCTMDRIDK
jgi:hypothetical protein